MTEPEMIPVKSTLDLIDAIQFYLSLCPQNLSHSEHILIENLRSASYAEQFLIQKLYMRTPIVFRSDSLQYFPIDEQEQLLKALESRNWTWLSPKWFNSKQKLSLHTTEELKAFCKERKLKRSGKKQLLLNRLTEHGFQSPLSVVIPRHVKLLRRICSTYLRDHHGNLTALVLDRMNIQSFSFVPYQRTTANPCHRSRREYSEYISFRKEFSEDSPTRLPMLREQFRFSALRFHHAQLHQKALSLEKTDRAQAIQYYQEIISQKTEFHAYSFLAEIYQRLALCLDRNKESKQALLVLKSGLQETFDLPQKLLLLKTGRRIAQKCGKGFPLLPELQVPFVRRLDIGEGEKRSNRIYYQDNVVESAVLKVLEEHGRIGYWSENGFWNMLFSMVFLPAMFAPIDGMLPSSILRAPIDFHSKEFYLKRKELIDSILDQITLGNLCQILENAEDMQEYSISGIDWKRYSFTQMIDIATLCPVSTIIAVLKILLLFPESAFRGMPDLFVLPAKEHRIAKCFPSRIPAGFLFLEIKSPNDTVSLHQKFWFHQLISYDQRVEIWNIKENI